MRLDSAANVRDLGGYPTGHGGMTRHGHFFEEIPLIV
ncbi:MULTISPECIES: tyrosine-protein phosphatase [Ferrimicrobium]|uniref:Tyrosine-protein phosphatase n=1 Tax=Ferrimicrobium acidiphilum TaxID=121039 RepID=A0ABV3Y519_9ACTN